jgi:hypothetical protein
MVAHSEEIEEKKETLNYYRRELTRRGVPRRELLNMV